MNIVQFMALCAVIVMAPQLSNSNAWVMWAAFMALGAILAVFGK